MFGGVIKVPIGGVIRVPIHTPLLRPKKVIIRTINQLSQSIIFFKDPVRHDVVR